MLWVLGLLLSFAEFCVWLEFGCMLPRSGGEKVYLEAVYRWPRFMAKVVFLTQAILLAFMDELKRRSFHVYTLLCGAFFDTMGRKVCRILKFPA